MGLPWYPRNMGKYAGDTKDLSMLEHGAYNLLLDYYYANGSIPQPVDKSPSTAGSTASFLLDHSRIYRVCGAMTKLEQDAVDFVLKRFFELDKKGSYRQSYADEVIEKQERTHEKKAAAGRKGGLSTAGSTATSTATDSAKANKNRDKDITPLAPQGGNGLSVWKGIDFYLTDSAEKDARQATEGLDFQWVKREYDASRIDKELPRSPTAHFLAWCRTVKANHGKG